MQAKSVSRLPFLKRSAKPPSQSALQNLTGTVACIAPDRWHFSRKRCIGGTGGAEVLLFYYTISRVGPVEIQARSVPDTAARLSKEYLAVRRRRLDFHAILLA